MKAGDHQRIQELLRVASRLPAVSRGPFLERAEPERADQRDEVASLCEHDAGRGELSPSRHSDLERAGPWRLTEPLGEAPPARLFRARHQTDSARSALLVVARHAPAARPVAQALEKQARSQAGLEDPALARMLEAGVDGEGTLFAAFEPVEGVPLAEMCDALRFTLPERVALVEEVALAVERAHAAGVVPLGLLPWSVLATWGEEGPRPALIAIDPWPLLALLDPEARAGRELLSALETSAPEALRGGPRGVRSDVFALGVLLYDNVTGTPPLGLRRLAGRRSLREELRLATRITPPLASARLAGLGREAQEAADARSTDVPRMVAELRSGLDDVLQRALAADPALRHPSAAALAADLAEWRSRPRRRGWGLSGMLRLRVPSRQPAGGPAPPTTDPR